MAAAFRSNSALFRAAAPFAHTPRRWLALKLLDFDPSPTCSGLLRLQMRRSRRGTRRRRMRENQLDSRPAGRRRRSTLRWGIAPAVRALVLPFDRWFCARRKQEGRS